MLNLQPISSFARTSILSAVYLLFFGVVSAQDATDFAIFSSDDVTLESNSVVSGDVYSGRDLNVPFAYGIGFQDEELNSGSMFAFQNYFQGSLSEINGSVFANGDATLDGSAEVFGDLFYGGVYTPPTSFSGGVEGLVQQQLNTVSEISLPPSSQFSAGTDDVITDESVALAPGDYRNLEITGFGETLLLTSGDYTFRQLDFQSSTTISLQILNNEPINVFLEGNADFGNSLEFIVNGVEIGSSLANSVADLAKLVTFETRGDVTIGFSGEFFGTIFAPDGNVNIDLQEMHGSIITGRPVTVGVRLDHQPSDYLIAQTAIPPTLLGDCNLDGVVDFFDISTFISILTSGGFQAEADCNEDGVVTFLDITPFIGILALGE